MHGMLAAIANIKLLLCDCWQCDWSMYLQTSGKCQIKWRRAIERRPTNKEHYPTWCSFLRVGYSLLVRQYWLVPLRRSFSLTEIWYPLEEQLKHLSELAEQPSDWIRNQAKDWFLGDFQAKRPTVGWYISLSVSGLLVCQEQPNHTWMATTNVDSLEHTICWRTYDCQWND